ncbi:hypothetical protein MLD38_008135 [Melastoma candidum]|uniref:Uncharacterized protein n=1 Tax=Melastoma candidum TaxID=119954 RepID=A0ACB9RTB3_9MYRT|nr:hypothetical protein MLD38_008135 [Melastoma candidum]
MTKTTRQHREERVLISEVVVRNKDGEELERKDLESEAIHAPKSSRPNSALNVKEVSDVEILSGGILKMHVSEAEIDFPSSIFRFIDSAANVFPLTFSCGEPTVGKTEPETILIQLTTKKGQFCQWASHFLEDGFPLLEGLCTLFEQDTTKVDLVMTVVERKSGGFSAGGGISSGITSGPLSGLIGSFAYSHRNVFGRNQKFNVSLERGQIDSIFRVNYTDPWIEGDDKRTSRTIMIPNSRTPGTNIHDQLNHNILTIGWVTAGTEFSCPIRPKWNGTGGIICQHADACDEKGNPVIKDFFSSPLTATIHMTILCLAKLESVCTGSGDHGSSMLALNVEQAVPLMTEWLFFSRVSGRARRGVELVPVRFILSLSDGHVVVNFSPHGSFTIGGKNGLRVYEEVAVGSGRSYIAGSGEVSFPVYGSVDGALFADYGSDF